MICGQFHSIQHSVHSVDNMGLVIAFNIFDKDTQMLQSHVLMQH